MAKKQPKFIRKAPVRRKEPGVGYVIPFFVVLAVLTVVSFIIPLRPTVSYIEKRNLAEFPEFSVEDLLSGDYFDDISTWYSDTFPGRETWIELASQTKSFHGNSDVMIAGDLEDNPDDSYQLDSTEPIDPTDPMEEVTQPVQDATEGEVEGATEGPTELPAEEPTEEDIILEESTEAPPTIPVEEWGGVDAGANPSQKSGTVIQIGDSLFQTTYFNTYFSDRYISVVNNAADKYVDQGIRVVSAPPPQSTGVMIEPEYMKKLKCADQKEAIDYLNDGLSDNVYFVDTVELLRAHNSEYIYFRTDHHWTALGAYYVYEAICEQLDLAAAPLDSFEVWDQGKFHGSLYYKAPKTKSLQSDNLIAYNPPGNLNTRIYRDGSSGFEWTVLTDMSKSKVSAKYSTFLSGDAPLVRIINNDLPDAGTALIIKDSFGNAIAPFFTQNYHTVYVVDYRYYSRSLSTLIKSFGVNDVLFLTNLGDIQTRAVGDLLQKYKK